jgi:hypothetical protein
VALAREPDGIGDLGYGLLVQAQQIAGTVYAPLEDIGEWLGPDWVTPACGTKQMLNALTNVRFWGQSGSGADAGRSPLLTQSGRPGSRASAAISSGPAPFTVSMASARLHELSRAAY